MERAPAWGKSLSDSVGGKAKRKTRERTKRIYGNKVQRQVNKIIPNDKIALENYLYQVFIFVTTLPKWSRRKGLISIRSRSKQVRKELSGKIQ